MAYDDDDEFDNTEHVSFAPQRFTKITLIRAGVDFLAHVAEGALCALRQIENAVIGHEIRTYEERNWAAQLQYDLESLPDTDNLE